MILFFAVLMVLFGITNIAILAFGGWSWLNFIFIFIDFAFAGYFFWTLRQRHKNR